MKLLSLFAVLTLLACSTTGLSYDQSTADPGTEAADAGEPSTSYSYEGHYDLSIGHVDVRVDQTNYLYGSYHVACTATGALVGSASIRYPSFEAFFAGGCPMAAGNQSLTFFPSQATLTAFVRAQGIPVGPRADTFPVCRLGTWGSTCNGR